MGGCGQHKKIIALVEVDSINKYNGDDSDKVSTVREEFYKYGKGENKIKSAILAWNWILPCEHTHR